MFSYVVLSLVFVSAQANFLQEIGDFFEPAEIKDIDMAKLGLTLFNIEWGAHASQFQKDIPLFGTISKFSAQIAAPLQFASIIICPQCTTHVMDIQNAIKSNNDVPRWLVETAVPLAVCPMFYAVDPQLVPICLVGGFGASVFLTHADANTVCQILPFCASKYKRESEDEESEESQELSDLVTESPFNNVTHAIRSISQLPVTQQKEVFKRVASLAKDSMNSDVKTFARKVRDVFEHIKNAQK
ncbi:unnamed protein product [Bursaphelenchus okinawaensis]|uniref:Uncharacterized protein n=1 Tax=Bursaphelenchus okinawaensis TaxID=465554 RepID=A0A811KM37_9BILA|nr:unnamed protein product [Bursaphelenchus okinawaensis]CAG9106383.1 unnamed protein product [Bursaphelenchus okinawaensis]